MTRTAAAESGKLAVITQMTDVFVGVPLPNRVSVFFYLPVPTCVTRKPKTPRVSPETAVTSYMPRAPLGRSVTSNCNLGNL